MSSPAPRSHTPTGSVASASHSASAQPHTQPQQAQGGLANAKMRKAAREEAERAARQEQDDLHSMKSYNEMLKNLLSKEIESREVAEGRVVEMTQHLENFKNVELENIRERHQTQLYALEQTLYAKFRAEHDSRIESIVAERLAAARAQDNAKYRDLKDIHAKLHVEFEDKYSQRFQKMERANRELSEKYTQQALRFDVIQSESKSIQKCLDGKDNLIKALEYRCSKFEDLKSSVKSLKFLVKHLSCRIFLHTYRLKKGLSNVYTSLRMLHEKLNIDKEYDRTSGMILPQHELEVWLGKTHALLTKNKAVQQAHFNMIFAGTTHALVHPNTMVTTPHLHANTTTTAPAAAGVPSAGAGGVAEVPPTPARPSPSLAAPPLSPPLSPSARRKRNASIARAPSSMQRFMYGGDPHTPSILKVPTLKLNFREMLAMLSDVEVVLRGCLIECLNKAAEWKCSSEDFFGRNQELIQEMVTMRETNQRTNNEVKSLQASLAMVEKTLNHVQDERKAAREIDAQAPRSLGASSSRSMSVHRDRDVTLRRLMSSTSTAGGPDQNGFDRDLIARGIEVQSGSEFTSSNDRTQQHNDNNATHTSNTHSEHATRNMIETHQLHTRLSYIDGTNESQLLALSHRDLHELSRHKKKVFSQSQGGAKGFFDHHSALLQVCIKQKQRIEELERAHAKSREKVQLYKSKLDQLHADQEYGWEVGQKMDRELDEHDGTTPHNTTNAQPYEPDEKSSESSSLSSSPSTGRRGGRRLTPAATRPGQLDVDDDQRPAATIRPTVPFSPPVYPVSPYAPGGGGVSTRHASRANSTNPSRGSTPASTLRGPALTMTIPAASRPPPMTPYAYEPASPAPATRPQTSPYSTAGSRSASAMAIRSSGAAILQHALAATQPLAGTASPSYAATPIYSPAPAPSAHAANRGPERVYGSGRPKSTDHGRLGVGDSKEHWSSRSARQQARTINPLLAHASLASTHTIAAALATLSSSPLDPSTAVTGDVRYDIISPYVAQPLPWERKDPVKWTPASTPYTEYAGPGSTAFAEGEETHTTRRREQERKPPVPRQKRSQSRDGSRSISPNRNSQPSQLDSNPNGAAHDQSSPVAPSPLSSVDSSLVRPSSSSSSHPSSRRRSSFGSGLAAPPPITAQPNTLTPQCTTYAQAGNTTSQRKNGPTNRNEDEKNEPTSDAASPTYSKRTQQPNELDAYAQTLASTEPNSSVDTPNSVRVTPQADSQPPIGAEPADEEDEYKDDAEIEFE